MNDNLTDDQASARAIDRIREIGKTYGRLIFQQAVILDLSLPEIEEGIDAAVADIRDYLAKNDVCEHDIEVSLYHLRLSIIEEGERLADMLPDHKPETIQ